MPPSTGDMRLAQAPGGIEDLARLRRKSQSAGRPWKPVASLDIPTVNPRGRQECTISLTGLPKALSSSSSLPLPSSS